MLRRTFLIGAVGLLIRPQDLSPLNPENRFGISSVEYFPIRHEGYDFGKDDFTAEFFYHEVRNITLPKSGMIPELKRVYLNGKSIIIADR